MRIQIIGYSGSGKSTLAKKLASFYRIPCLHMDNVHFYGNWQERSVTEMNQILRDFLNANRSWVIDGNYMDVAPERFNQSDLTIFLSYPRFYCYKKCRERFLKNRGGARDSCPCEEKFDWEFRRWILLGGRTKERKRRMEDAFLAGNGAKVMLRSAAELDTWLKKQIF